MTARSLSLALVLVLAAPAFATEQFDGKPLSTTPAKSWERVELHEDKAPLFTREPFAPAARREHEEITAAFGEKEPSSSRFLLHVARGWDRKDDALPPVVLVHGAVVDATRSFGAGSYKGRGGDGLAARLVDAGRRVFAITFAHPHGCSFMQAEQLANAIARVKAITGAPKVDLVAHSKGGIVARIYVSDLRKPGMTKYRGDVRRLALVGVPNGGIDVAFAYPNLNYYIIVNKASGPLVWTDALCYGTWQNLKDLSLYNKPDGGGCFPGQAQMLARWDATYGLYEDESQYDVKTTYNGGRGSVSASLGIDRAIKDGENVIARLEKANVEKGLEVAILAGTKPFMLGWVGERRGPSDGLLLVRSALNTQGLVRGGAKILRRDTLCFSHIELTYAEPAVRWIERAIGP
jgi:triacylglycerol lipase